MKKKYQIALVVIGCLIALLGLSYAYFAATNTGGGKGGSTTVETVTLDEVGFNIEGMLEFKDLDIYPGHKNISKIKVTALGNNDTINYKLVWEGINTLNTPLRYYVYKTTTNEEPSITCKKEIEQVGTSKYYYETCTNNSFDNLGTIVNQGEITKTTEKQEFILSPDEVIKGTKEGNVIYYYVVLEYPNLEESQNIDMGGKFEGQVTVKKESDLLADITIKKMYKQNDTGYEEITTMPDNTYIINTEKSTCTNNAIPTLKNNKVLVTNLNTSGTECNIYFDKKDYKTIEEIIPTLNAKTETPDFSQVATTDEGVYAVSDGMYGGTSYYWRGAVTNNYVKFAGFCWRIVRINGDKNMRLIYDGSTCHANGTSTAESIAKTSIAYNTSYNQSNYVGWTYEGQLQRPTDNTTSTASNAKTQLESWYSSNITGTNANKVADGKYCNDRNVESGYTWAINGNTFHYAGRKRLWETYAPALSCSSNDVYTLKVGLITADEVEFAGGKNAINTSYYLYNGRDYWTMSPSYWSSPSAGVFFVRGSDGFLVWDGVYGSYGLRPVINLRSDVEFNLNGDGTLNNPYVVKGAE